MVIIINYIDLVVENINNKRDNIKKNFEKRIEEYIKAYIKRKIREYIDDKKRKIKGFFSKINPINIFKNIKKYIKKSR